MPSPPPPPQLGTIERKNCLLQAENVSKKPAARWVIASTVSKLSELRKKIDDVYLDESAPGQHENSCLKRSRFDSCNRCVAEDFQPAP